MGKSEPFVPQAEGSPFAWQIAEAEGKLEDVKRRYLKRWGWTETSSTPGAFWLWQRDFGDHDQKMAAVHQARKLPSPHRPYGIITAPTDLAVSMTKSALDEQRECGECED